MDPGRRAPCLTWTKITPNFTMLAFSFILDELPALIQLNHKLNLWPKSEKVPEICSALERNGTMQDTSLPLAWEEKGPVGMHAFFLLLSYNPYFLTSFFPHQFDSGPQKPIFSFADLFWAVLTCSDRHRVRH